MDVLNELVYIVGRNKVKGINMKDLYLNHHSSKLSQFYQGLSDGLFQSDEDARTLIYPEDQDTDKFRTLKSQLKKRLLNYLFFIDLELPTFTDRQKAFLECNKQWAMTNILFGRGARNAGVETAEKLLKKALHFEFNEIVVDVSKLLRFHFGVIAGNKKKYKKYKHIYERHELYYLNENRIEGYYTDVIFSSFSQKNSKIKLERNLEFAMQKIRPLLAQTPSYKAQLYGYLTEVILHASQFENHKMIDACQKAIAFFESKSYQANTPLQIFYYQQLIAFTQLGKFEKGKRVAERCLSLLEEGTFNWFKYYESYFILATHTSQYSVAYKIFDLVVNHPRFLAMPEETKEIWKIYEAYLHLLQRSKKLQGLNMDTTALSKFRLGRFLNEIPVYSKEKRGMNIAVLVIQILLSIQKGEYNKAIDRIEAIEKYCTRYLRNEETLRSYYFIKMLLVIPSQSFHKEAVLRHTKNFQEKLNKLPLEIANQDHKIEVIPYEELWNLGIQLLQEKKKRYSKL